MSKETQTIKVQHVEGEPLRYYVESWSNPKYPYFVDLMENDGNGLCSCKDFITRCGPNWKDTKKIVEYGHPGNPNPKRTRCKHIHICKDKFANDTLQGIAKEAKINLRKMGQAKCYGKDTSLPSRR